jgi:hypothetical protein
MQKNVIKNSRISKTFPNKKTFKIKTFASKSSKIKNSKRKKEKKSKPDPFFDKTKQENRTNNFDFDIFKSIFGKTKTKTNLALSMTG